MTDFALKKVLDELVSAMKSKELEGLGDEESERPFDDGQGISKTTIEVIPGKLKDLGAGIKKSAEDFVEEIPGEELSDKLKAAIETGKRAAGGAMMDMRDAASDLYDEAPGVDADDKLSALFEKGKRKVGGALMDARDAVDPEWEALKRKLRGE